MEFKIAVSLARDSSENENNVNSLHALDCLAKTDLSPVPNVQLGKPKRKVCNILLFKGQNVPKHAETGSCLQKQTWPYHFAYWGRSKVWPSLAFSGNDCKSFLDSRAAKFSLMRSTSSVSCTWILPQISAHLAFSLGFPQI